MDIFNLNEKEFEREIDKLLNKTTKEELLDELVNCGLVLKEE